MFAPWNRVTSFDYEGQQMTSFSHVEAVSGGNIGGFQRFQSSSKRDAQTQPAHGPTTRTLEPSVTGTSVLAVRYKDGVMLAADTLASYGSLARFRDQERLCIVGKNTLIGGSGDVSDWQFLTKHLNELITSYEIVDDGSHLSPDSIHSYLTRLMYSRRNKFDPLWNMIVVAGYENGRSFLGLSDLRGSSFEDNIIATGYGSYIAIPLLRSAWRPDLSREEAIKLLEDCMRVLFYRDARSSNRIQMANISAEGPKISEPYELQTDWTVGNILYKGYNVRNVETQQ